MNLKKFIANQPLIFNLIKLGGDYAPQPLFLLVHLTLACNLQCPDCYQQIDDFYQPFRGQFIKPDDFEKILFQARQFWFRPRFHFFGGEPLLHPDFAALLKLTDQAGFKSSITTNGVLLQKHLPQIINSKLNQINISWFFPDQPIEKETNDWEKIRSAINELKKATNRRKIINLNCVIGENNHNRLINITRELSDSRLPIDTLVFQHPYFHWSKPPQIDLSALGLQAKELKKIKSDFKIIFIPNIKTEDLDFFYNQINEKRFKKDCLMPWLGLNILPDLTVAPGGGVLGCNRVVGDLKRETLKNIWNNSLTKNFRRAIIKKHLPPACAHCCHRRYY